MSVGLREIDDPTVVHEVSYQPIDLDQWAIRLGSMIPDSNAAGPTRDQFFSDIYLETPIPDSDSDAAMPLYLGDELGPSTTRHKRHERRSVVLANLQKERQKHVATEVEMWEALGRDQYLRAAMDLPQANLRGVPLKPRTKAEVIEAAEIEWDQKNASGVAERKHMYRMGYRYDLAQEKWVPGHVASHRLAKRERKVVKAKEFSERLQNLRLNTRKNQFVPLEARKGVVGKAKRVVAVRGPRAPRAPKSKSAKSGLRNAKPSRALEGPKKPKSALQIADKWTPEVAGLLE